MAHYQLVRADPSADIILFFDRTQPLKVWKQIEIELSENFGDGVVLNPPPKSAEQRCTLYLVDFYKTKAGFDDFLTKMGNILTTCGHQVLHQ